MAAERQVRTVESTYVLQVQETVDLEPEDPYEVWRDVATVTVPARTKRRTAIEHGLREAGLTPEHPMKVRVLAADSAHISEVTSEEREPRLRVV